MRIIVCIICACLLIVLENSYASEQPAPSSPALINDSTKLPTLFIIGDSTVKNGTRGLEGWGDAISPYFELSRINIENRARGGRSSRTFLTEGLWASVLSQMQPGDFVLMQFGHNDGGPIDHGTARASIKGIGDETQTVTDAVTGKTEIVHTYGWYLRKYIDDARAKGVIPIVLSPIPRNIWSKENKVLTNEKDYGGWAASVAHSEGAPFIDLNRIIASYYDEMGPIIVKTFFPGDHTHTDPAGAALNADCVVQGLRKLQDCSLKVFLKPEIGTDR
jgi:lysophospholipase L1-like esterase